MTRSSTRAFACAIALLAGAPFAARAQDVFDAAPVSSDASVKVTSTYHPAPTSRDGRHKPGVNAWVFQLAPVQSQRISVAQQVDYPKDVTIRNLPVVDR